MTPVHKGASPYGTPVTPRMNLNSNFGMATIPSIQLLGLEMLLHFLLGPEVVSFAKQNKLILSLEPLEHPLISSSSFSPNTQIHLSLLFMIALLQLEKMLLM